MGRLARACLISTLALAIPLALMPVSFATNDDGVAQLVMAGIIAPEPAAYVPFMGMIVPWVASKLFAVAPGVAWWPVIHIVTLWASIAVTCWTLDFAAANRLPGISPTLRTIGIAVSSIVFFAPFVVRLQFTTTGTVAVASGMFAALTLNDRNCKGQVGALMSIVAPLMLVVIGAGYRLLCAQLAVAFWLLSVSVLIASAPGAAIADRFRFEARQIKVGALAATFVLLVTLGCNWFFSSTGSWALSWDLAVAQAEYTDYPDTPYKDDPDLYESVGWDEDLARLSRGWYQMDARQTTEAYQTINEQNTAPFDTFMQNPLGEIKNRSSQIAVWVPMVYLCLQVVLLSLVLCCGRQKVRVGATVASVLLFVLLGYLLVRGRVNERAVYSVLIPCVFALMSLLFVAGRGSAGDDCATLETKCDKACVAIYYLVVALELLALAWLAQGGFVHVVVAIASLFAFCCLMSFLGSRSVSRFGAVLGAAVLFCLAPGTVKQMGWSSDDYKDLHGRQMATEALFDYCEENPDIFYIYDLTGYFVPTDLLSVRWPKNQTNWGGWKNTYFWYGEALKRDGYSGIPTSDWFLDPDVRFVCGYEPNGQLLLHYLRGLYGEDIEMVYEKTLAGKLEVYRFEH